MNIYAASYDSAQLMRSDKTNYLLKTTLIRLLFCQLPEGCY